MAPPNGFMIAEATMSLDTAALGVTPNSRMRIGVIRAPPTAPVVPTSKPTMRPATTIVRLTRTSARLVGGDDRLPGPAAHLTPARPAAPRLSRPLLPRRHSLPPSMTLTHVTCGSPLRQCPVGRLHPSGRLRPQ